TDFITSYFDACYQQQETNSIAYIKNRPNEFPDEFRRITQNKKVSALYTLIRCGLVHEYFMKGESTIFMHPTTATCGILIDENAKPKLIFIVDRYYSDFRKAFEEYYSEIVKGKSGPVKQQKLKSKF